MLMTDVFLWRLSPGNPALQELAMTDFIGMARTRTTIDALLSGLVERAKSKIKGLSLAALSKASRGGVRHLEFLRHAILSAADAAEVCLSRKSRELLRGDDLERKPRGLPRSPCSSPTASFGSRRSRRTRRTRSSTSTSRSIRWTIRNLERRLVAPWSWVQTFPPPRPLNAVVLAPPPALARRLVKTQEPFRSKRRRSML